VGSGTVGSCADLRQIRLVPGGAGPLRPGRADQGEEHPQRSPHDYGAVQNGRRPFPHLIESPAFGHSDAHVVLQIADLLASAILFPTACAAYCGCLIHNLHLNNEFADVRTRYAPGLRQLERYPDAGGKRCSGIRVIDHLNRMPTRHLYEEMEPVGL
jgi:hypothetical protein